MLRLIARGGAKTAEVVQMHKGVPPTSCRNPRKTEVVSAMEATPPVED